MGHLKQNPVILKTPFAHRRDLVKWIDRSNISIEILQTRLSFFPHIGTFSGSNLNPKIFPLSTLGRRNMTWSVEGRKDQWNEGAVL